MFLFHTIIAGMCDSKGDITGASRPSPSRYIVDIEVYCHVSVFVTDWPGNDDESRAQPKANIHLVQSVYYPLDTGSCRAGASARTVPSARISKKKVVHLWVKVTCHHPVG